MVKDTSKIKKFKSTNRKKTPINLEWGGSAKRRLTKNMKSGKFRKMAKFATL